MLILLTIFLLVLIPVVMLVIHLVRPKFSIQGFLAILAVLSGWICILFARQDIPHSITLLQWQPANFFTDPPSLLIDDISWYFALTIITLGLSSIVTSIARLGQSRLPDNNLREEKIEVIEVQGQPGDETPPGIPKKIDENKTGSNWQSWAGILIITSLGLVAVTAGNMFSMLQAWAALDIIELYILLSQAAESKSQRRINLAFSLRVAGIGMVLLAGIDAWSQGISLAFNSINPTIAIYLILAAGLRLSTLLVQLPFPYHQPQKREFGTILRLIPVAACYILVIRVASIGIPGSVNLILLAIISLTGLLASVRWIYSEDVIQGAHYWLLGTASLSIASAILKYPTASIAWSIASLLSGGLMFSLFIHPTALIPIAFLGLVGFTALPFSPTWLGTDLYTLPDMLSNTIPRYIFYLLSLAFLLTHSLLLAGFIRQVSRGFFPRLGKLTVQVERWVWFLFPVGLLFILASHFLSGVLLNQKTSAISISGWIMGGVAVILSGVIWYFNSQYILANAHRNHRTTASFFSKFLSLEGVSQFFDSFFSSFSRLITLISAILEGDGGILWAFVLFALIFVFLLR